MLIPSHRHTSADLELWAELEEADHAHAYRLPLKIERALAAIRAFVATGPAYCGVSWGKDSVVVAHLCWLADRSIPLIHLRPTNHNPDCDAVRDNYLTKFPGQPYSEAAVNYGDLHARSLPAHELDRETDSRWYAAIQGCGKPFGGRHILGIRADESSGRKLRQMVHGESSPNGCAPITRWSAQDVFAYLASHDLPVHPAYAMLGGGRWPRERLRVAEIGDTHGTGSGRREWEQEYYVDIIRKLESKR